MVRKLLLAGFVLFVALPGGWLGVEHFRGRNRLAAVLAEQAARGAVFDMGRIVGDAVPAVSNALPEQVAAARRMGDAGKLLAPAYRMVAPGRAIPPTRVDAWGDGRGPGDWSAVHAWVEAHGDDLDALHAALDAPVRRAELNYSVGFAKLLLPHLSPIKNSATALALSAMDAARRGDLEGALVDLEAIRVVQADLATEPLLISQLVRIACVSIANSRIWSVLHAGDWNEAQLARIQAALPARDLGPGLLRGLEGERAMCLAELRGDGADLATVWASGDEMMAGLNAGGAGLELPGNVDEAMELAETMVRRLAEVLRLRVLFPIWRFGWGDQAVAYYLEVMDTLLRANQAAFAASSLEVYERTDLLPLLRPPAGWVRFRAVYASALGPALAKAVTKVLRAETEIGLNEAAIALRRHQLRHGRFPDTLDALVPEFLAAVPVDAMDGKPLRYRRDGEKEFVLWSLGDDLKDDGGDATWPEDKTKTQWWNARDAVWPQPASAEQIAAWSEKEKQKAAKVTSGPVPGRNLDLMRKYGLIPSTNGAPAPASPPPDAGGR
jgi:hypothetical protein